jgi:hypothetical protein
MLGPMSGKRQSQPLAQQSAIVASRTPPSFAAERWMRNPPTIQLMKSDSHITRIGSDGMLAGEIEKTLMNVTGIGWFVKLSVHLSIFISTVVR